MFHVVEPVAFVFGAARVVERAVAGALPANELPDVVVAERVLRGSLHCATREPHVFAFPVLFTSATRLCEHNVQSVFERDRLYYTCTPFSHWPV